MSFYPILSAPGCSGVTTIYNFPPNDWEDVSRRPRVINLTWSDSNMWRSVRLGELDSGSMRTFSRDQIDIYCPPEVLPLLSLDMGPLPEWSETLPLTMARTSMPAWRATLGLRSDTSITSYQGELDPFPSQGTMLAFAPFIQYGNEIENYMLFVNLERSPKTRSGLIEIFSANEPWKLKGHFNVRSNSVTCLNLDHYNFSETELPSFACKDMCGIPLFFSKTSSGNFLSLEHTHPPVSYVVHGRRVEMQKTIKTKWFNMLGHL